MDTTLCIPFVAAIIERNRNDKTELLLQTRSNRHHKSIYNGTLEFAAGTMDKPYENVYDAIIREIKEETGMTVKHFIDDSRTKVLSPRKFDKVQGFRPFCCTQQLKEGRPWVGFIFRCEVEDGTPRGQVGESADVHWEDAEVFKQKVLDHPETIFTLELPAWHYYFGIV